MSEKQITRATIDTCLHCESYHAHSSGLCGNCELLSPETRAEQLKLKKQLVENKKAADRAAHEAYRKALRDQNHAAAAAVTGQSDTSAERAESRNLSLGK